MIIIIINKVKVFWGIKCQAERTVVGYEDKTSSSE